MDIQNVGFLARTVRLESPKPAELQNAYRSLSARGTVVITGTAGDIPVLLLAAERAGFHGLRIDGTAITAHKGKEGPCYDTGRSARYGGSAAAALDDDHHLLRGRIRVCEKTARLYASDAYQGRIEVTDGDPALLARLEKDPAPFDCDTFEADVKALADSLRPGPAPGGAKTAVCYPGPFKLLILEDGSMIRRGQPVLLPAAQAEALVRDGAHGIPGPAEEPRNFLPLFRELGPACLLGDLPFQGAEKPPRDADLDALDELPPAMKRRLRAVLSRGEDYFLLTGSDPAQKDGCCPSNDVGVANLLVEKGLLDSRGEIANSDCPVTLYAFATEIRPGDGRPVFVRNAALRSAIAARLDAGPRLSRKAWVRLALLALLAAAVITLGVALLRQIGL